MNIIKFIKMSMLQKVQPMMVSITAVTDVPYRTIMLDKERMIKLLQHEIVDKLRTTTFTRGQAVRFYNMLVTRDDISIDKIVDDILTKSSDVIVYHGVGATKLKLVMGEKCVVSALQLGGMGLDIDGDAVSLSRLTNERWED